MSKFRCEYTYTKRYSSPNHQWVLVGARGAIHLHISGPHRFDGEESFSAGLEMHYRQPPDYMANSAPSHDECQILKCPCWHDGTSLYAQERFLPRWLSDPNNHDAMFAALEREYRDRMEFEA